MNLAYVNSTILQNLIEKIDTTSENNKTNAIHPDVLFDLNFIIAVRLRLIKPIRDLGDRGPLKVSLKPGEYFYSLNDVKQIDVTGNKIFAAKYLLPEGSQYVLSTVSSGVQVSFHCPFNKAFSKILKYNHINLKFCIACLQYSQMLWESAKEKSVKG